MSVRWSIPNHNNGIPLILLASIATLSCLIPLQAAQSAPASSPPAQYNQFLANMGTTLLGFNAAFTQTLAVTVAGNVALNWKTTTPQAVQGKWSVADSPTGTSLASGFVYAPAPGQVAQFNIDFSKIAPPNPPAAESPMIYYISVQPTNNQQKGLALPSNQVKVFYAKGR